MRAGRLLEPIISQLYRERTQKLVSAWPMDIVWSSKQFRGQDWAFCTPERMSHNMGTAVHLELKSSRDGEGWGYSHTEDVHPYCYCQVQWQMMVLSTSVARCVVLADRCEVACLIGGQELRTYTVLRDEAYQKTLLEKAAEFWGMVLDANPPDYDWNHPSTLPLARQLNKPKEDMVMTLEGDEIALLLRQHVEVSGQLKALEKAKDAVEAKIHAHMGDASLGLTRDGYSARRTEVHRRGYTVEPGTYTTLRVRGPKHGHD